ncbi:MAG: pseudaminic acid synthase [Magnetococcales bacterium]|nr:pseudaminic acid synthase [Magnetococcales bacterium]
MMPTHSSSTITIDGRTIGPDHPPYIIAELSANHGGDLERAKRIIRLAAESGAHAIKFQAYTADSMTLDCDMPGFVIESDTLWKGQKLYDLYAKAATPYDWFPELFALARQLGITPFASPFDDEAVEMLEALQAPAHKIASFETIDLALIERCAGTGKPLIISTGLCTREEIDEAVAAFRSAGGRELALLKCNSAYPADPKEANLSLIPDMAHRYGVPIGYSDHTLGTVAAVTACSMGACIVEKHVIDAREPATADSEFSALPDDLKALVEHCRTAFESRGRTVYGPTERERQSLPFRRSLHVVKDVAQGEAFTSENVRALRPGHGMKPKHLREILGKTASRAISVGEPLTPDLVSES